MRYTYKNTIDDKTIYISGINNEIIDLQKDLWKYLSIVGVIVLFTVYLAVEVSIEHILDLSMK